MATIALSGPAFLKNPLLFPCDLLLPNPRTELMKREVLVWLDSAAFSSEDDLVDEVPLVFVVFFTTFALLVEASFSPDDKISFGRMMAPSIWRYGSFSAICWRSRSSVGVETMYVYILQ